MKVLDIIYIRYLDALGQKMTVGGIQTYISQLADLAVHMGYCVRIFQFADKEFQIATGENITVFGIPVSGIEKKDKFIAQILKTQNKLENQYVTIFANVDNMLPKTYVPNSICIQHGIGWDRIAYNKVPLGLRLLVRTRFAYRLIKAMKNVDEVVCVDNNFINWYRALDSHRDVQLTSIMNFTEIQPLQKRKVSDTISIVFARRFFDYRGTRIFAPAAKRLVLKYPNLTITFAGEGPDEKYLRDMFKDEPNIHFTQYDSRDSISFHRQFDIAVVPTTGSEGTSLSLLEAMAAGCAVVCTNVGGMTNIIIDGYNGLMVNPNSEDIFEALNQLIQDTELRSKIALCGYDTVKSAFSLDKWKQKWARVIERHCGNTTKEMA